jgi:hypothetical protein
MYKYLMINNETGEAWACDKLSKLIKVADGWCDVQLHAPDVRHALDKSKKFTSGKITINERGAENE